MPVAARLALLLAACAAPPRAVPPAPAERFGAVPYGRVARFEIERPPPDAEEAAPSPWLWAHPDAAPTPPSDLSWSEAMRWCSDRGGPSCCGLFESCYWNPQASTCDCP